MNSRADYLQGNSDDTETSDEDVDDDEDEGAAASSDDDVDTEMEPDSQMPSHFIDMSNLPDSFEESSLDFDIEVRLSCFLIPWIIFGISLLLFML